MDSFYFILLETVNSPLLSKQSLTQNFTVLLEQGLVTGCVCKFGKFLKLKPSNFALMKTAFVMSWDFRNILVGSGGGEHPKLFDRVSADLVDSYPYSNSES